MKIKIFVRLVTAFAVLLAGVPFLQAHDVARTESRVEVHGREVLVALTLNLTELRDPVINFPSGGRITIADLDREIGKIFDSVQRH